LRIGGGLEVEVDNGTNKGMELIHSWLSETEMRIASHQNVGWKTYCLLEETVNHKSGYGEDEL